MAIFARVKTMEAKKKDSWKEGGIWIVIEGKKGANYVIKALELKLSPCCLKSSHLSLQGEVSSREKQFFIFTFFFSQTCMTKLLGSRNCKQKIGNNSKKYKNCYLRNVDQC